MNTPTGKAPRQNQKKPGTRHSHSIRFSDSEWRLVEQASSRHGISTGEFVRSGALAAAEGHTPVSHIVNFSVGHAALIEAIYRAVYLLATISREQMIEAGREADIDGIVTEARDAMAQAMNVTQDG